MNFIDTHCHIHEADYPLDPDVVLSRAREAGVEQLICVGTSLASSQAALSFAAGHEQVYAAIGVHPHETSEGCELTSLTSTDSLVAVGEIGLDYFYSHSPREVQLKGLESQLQYARDQHLPVIFHVREAFDDFWPVLANFPELKGELHSFTDSQVNLDIALARGLYIGINGISTFTKDPLQQELFTHIPLERLLLETDAPFLTPTPFRGTVNEPAFVRQVALHQADRRGISLEQIAAATTTNARALFALT